MRTRQRGIKGQAAKSAARSIRLMRVQQVELIDEDRALDAPVATTGAVVVLLQSARQPNPITAA